MIKYNEWLKSAEKLQKQIEDFFKKTEYLEREQILIPDLFPTEESLYTKEQLNRFCHELEEAYYQVKRLNAEVLTEGTIYRGPYGRFWLDEEELACGRSVELLYKDTGLDDIEYWHAGHIDHNGTKYYFTGDRSLELEGMTARIKRRL